MSDLLAHCWQIQLGDVVMGANTPFEIRSEGLGGLGIVAVEGSDMRRPFGDGMFFGKDYLTNRAVTVPLMCFNSLAMPRLAKAWEPMRDGTTEMKVWLPQGIRTLIGRPRRFETDHTNLRSGVISIDCQFDCTDPWVYGEETSLALIDPIVGRGMRFPHGGTIVFNVMSGPVSGEAWNNGNVPAYPTAKIFGPCVDPLLENLDTGELLRLSITVPAGDWLDVDFRDGSVLYRGQEARWPEVPGSVWWRLPPGLSNIAYRSSGQANGSTCSLTWRDTYNIL